MIRNGINVEALEGYVELLRTTPQAGTVSARGQHRWRGGYALEWHADQVTIADQTLTRDHTTAVDLPKELGGGNHGPAPGELLIAALGACVANQFVEHAARRGVRIDELEVSCESRLDLRGVYQIAEVRPRLAGIRIGLRVRSDADDEVLAELLSAALRTSPVADSLANPVPLEPSVQRAA